MGKGCSVEGCNAVHYAKGKCRWHYVMPSKIPNFSKEIELDRTTKPKKEKGIPELIKLADIVFSRWIKKRDQLTDRTFKCIACGEFKPIREMECGHFFSRTYSALRYNEDNSSGECHNCNCHDDQHLKGYEVRLKEKIGLERFNLLLENYNKQIKWDRQELLDLIAKYK